MIRRGKMNFRPYRYCDGEFKRLVCAKIWQRWEIYTYQSQGAVRRMDSFEFNKIAGAVLGTALAILGLKQLSGIIYHGEAPEKQGYAIAVAEPEEAATGGEAAGEAKPICVLLASASAENGMAEFGKCKGCHSVSNDGKNGTGPGLWDVVERPMSAHAGYTYSEAMAGKTAEKWTYENLNAWLLAPKTYIPGTKMAFGGIKNEAKRADVIAYLASLSDSPKPFPSP
jgi:cytochrome c